MIYRCSDDDKQKLIEIRRFFHTIPEIGTHLPKTSAEVEKYLNLWGITHRKNKSDSGIVAWIDGKTDGKCVALRADMDGLEIREETGLPYQSVQNMHACGHDSHIAGLLGACKLIQDAPKDWHGRIYFLFQTGEETAEGSKIMIQDNPDVMQQVSAVFGMHLGNIDDSMSDGMFGLKRGAFMASYDKFVVRIKGKGGHGSAPERTTDALAIAVEVANSLNLIRSRELAGIEPGVISVCKIEAGATYNVIPDTAVLEGTFRALNDATRVKIAQRIEEIAFGIAHTLRGEAVTEIVWGAKVVYNDEVLSNLAADVISNLYGSGTVNTELAATMGGEDFAQYSECAPACFLFFNTTPEDKKEIWRQHNSRFDLDESQLYKASEVYANIAVKYLESEI